MIIRSKNQLNVGQWYTVRIERKVKQGHMKIDNNPKIFGKSNGRTRGLNIHSPIFFGGINRKFHQISASGYSTVSNCHVVWNNRGGYYIGLFGHYIKNHVLFNKFF